MRYTWLFLALFFLVSAPLSYGGTNAGTIQDAEFVIEKEKKNKLNQEQRLFFKAPGRTTKRFHKPLASLKTLTVPEVLFNPISPVYLPFSLEKSKNKFLFNHYARLGISSLVLPYIEIGLANRFVVKGTWSATIAFLPQLWNDKARKSLLCLEGQYGTKSWQFQPNVRYEYNCHEYEHKIKGAISKLHQSRVGLLVKQANASLTQNGKINLYFTNYQDQKISEQLFTIRYKCFKQLNNWALKIASYSDVANYVNNANQQTRLIFSAIPSLNIPLSKVLGLKAGLIMAYHNDPIPGKIVRFNLYPMVKINYAIAAYAHPYIGLKGMAVGSNVEPLHLRQVVAKNPFIAQNWKLSHCYEYFKLYGGIKGNILSTFLYHFRIAYQGLKNQSKMVQLTKKKVKMIAYPNETKVLKATGLVDYTMLSKKFNTVVKGIYYYHPVNASLPAWWYHKPGHKLKLACAYNFHPKWLFKSTLRLTAPTTVKDMYGLSIQQHRQIDLGVGIDYFISQKFTAFLMVNNLLNRTHVSYTSYPDKKINITGGLQYRW